MLDAVINRAKCLKYSYLNGAPHRTSYRGGTWRVRTWDGLTLSFPVNPYLAVFECYGYLKEGAWTLEPGMCVVDAGACYGEFSIYASARVGPTGRVIVLEPDPKNIKILERAIASRELKHDNITIVRSGLWSHRDTLEFAAEGGAGSSIVGAKERDLTRSSRTISIDVVGLSDLMSDLSLERLDFVKMDIEGAEVDVCAASLDLFKRMKTRVAIASYHKRDGKRTAEILEPMFRGAGMQSETGFSMHRTTYAWT